METWTKSLYRDFRCVGWRAKDALWAARTVAEFDDLEDELLVRIRVEPEEENYFDVYGKPDTEKERKEIIEIIDQLGCWVVFTEYRLHPEGKWEIGGAVGMCTGYQNPESPFENEYVPGLMWEAIEAYRKTLWRKCA